MASDSEGEGTESLFREPEDFYKPEPEPTIVTHRMLNGQELTLRLVGHSPLWGHLLWNAGRTVADYLEAHWDSIISGKTVLELGAGAGLPSIVSALKGAEMVVVTDYPDKELVDNLRLNTKRNCPSQPIHVEGFLWGANTAHLTTHLPQELQHTGFDVLILADLLFNHSEHTKLLKTIHETLRKSRDAQALVFFTPYRPWLLDKDLAFFDLAKGAGLSVEKILEKEMDEVMFVQDPGDERLRRTVFGYSLRWLPEPLASSTLLTASDGRE